MYTETPTSIAVVTKSMPASTVTPRSTNTAQPTSKNSQESLAFSSLEVGLWPEFDRPSMLVIYNGVLSPDALLPAKLTLRIPARVGEPNGLAIRQEDGALLSVSYENQESGDWNLITFTATSSEIQMEYFDPELEIIDNRRHYEYHWPGDYTIESFVVQAQQPIGASDLSFTPIIENSFEKFDYTYHTRDFGRLSSGETFTLTMDYTK